MQPSLADVYLVSQIDGARRFKVDMARSPNSTVAVMSKSVALECSISVVRDWRVMAHCRQL